MKAYHFLREDMTGLYGNEPPWKVGERRSVEGGLCLCDWGYHYGLTPSDALIYAPGPILCLVEVSEVGPKGKIKSCSRSRKLLRAVNATTVLHEVGCDIAEDILPLFEEHSTGDKGPRIVLETKRQWLAGKASDLELAAARVLMLASREEKTGLAAHDAAWAASWASGLAPSIAVIALAVRATALATPTTMGGAACAAWDTVWAATEAKYRGWQNMKLMALLENEESR